MVRIGAPEATTRVIEMTMTQRAAEHIGQMPDLRFERCARARW
jgi:hypothetical protein